MPPSQKCQEQLYKMMSKKIGHLNVAILKCLYMYMCLRLCVLHGKITHGSQKKAFGHWSWNFRQMKAVWRGCRELNWCPLKRQQALLIPEPSPRPINADILKVMCSQRDKVLQQYLIISLAYYCEVSWDPMITRSQPKEQLWAWKSIILQYPWIPRMEIISRSYTQI